MVGQECPTDSETDSVDVPTLCIRRSLDKLCSMKVNWKPSVRATAINAARWIAASRKLPQAGWNDALLLLAREMQLRLASDATLDSGSHWIDLICQAEGINFAKRPDSPIINPTLLLDLTDRVESTVREIAPQLDEQLRLRIGPIQQHWDGYGNAILAHLHRMIGLPRRSGSLTILAVQPLVEGDGQACPPARTLFIEALLTNVLPDLPEILRLAWLVSHISTWPDTIDPRFETGNSRMSSVLRQRRFRDIQSLALIPAILAAAEIVEIARCDHATIALALDQFSPRQPESADLANVLMHWWETLLQTKPDWSVALTALSLKLSPSVI